VHLLVEELMRICREVLLSHGRLALLPFRGPKLYDIDIPGWWCTLPGEAHANVSNTCLVVEAASPHTYDAAGPATHRALPQLVQYMLMLEKLPECNMRRSFGIGTTGETAVFATIKFPDEFVDATC
jgi:hypothetical protein